MTHPYRTSTQIAKVSWKPTLRHRVTRLIQKMLVKMKGTFISRHPWPCPQCGRRGLGKLVKRGSVHWVTASSREHRNGILLGHEWIVLHSCCDTAHPPRPAMTQKDIGRFCRTQGKRLKRGRVWDPPWIT